MMHEGMADHSETRMVAAREIEFAPFLASQPVPDGEGRPLGIFSDEMTQNWRDLVLIACLYCAVGPR